MGEMLQAFLREIGLEKYYHGLRDNGLATIDDLWAIEEGDLIAKSSRAGMLKGHIMKLKKRVEEIKA
jgi:hypothetical protein